MSLPQKLERNIKIMELREADYSYGQIAKRMKISKQRVQQIVHAAINNKTAKQPLTLDTEYELNRYAKENGVIK